MDTNTSDAKTQGASEFVSVEAELEEVYAQLESARQKLEELKSHATINEASAGSDGEESEVVAVVGDGDAATVAAPVEASNSADHEDAAQYFEAAATGDEGTVPPADSAPNWAPYEGTAAAEEVADDASPTAPDEGYQVPTPDQQAAYGTSIPPQTPPTPPYGTPTYSQMPPQSPPQQPYYQQPYYQPQYVQTKDHVAAGLLAIFLGSLGIHKFYLGYNTAGFIMLAVSIIGSIVTFGLAGAVMALIGLIEGIVYLTKSQSDFEQVYVFNKREWF
ncbi:MAG: TM2 domain-containing protein [Raoultibacter sp.]